MILTEPRHIVAVACARHFGRAAEACYVSQRRLSVSIKKLEEEIDVKIFERGASEVTVTPLGDEIVRQAQRVIEQARFEGVRQARQGRALGPAAPWREIHHRALPAARPGAPGHRTRAADRKSVV